jgi:hypothetical protein
MRDLAACQDVSRPFGRRRRQSLRLWRISNCRRIGFGAGGEITVRVSAFFLSLAATPDVILVGSRGFANMLITSAAIPGHDHRTRNWFDVLATNQTSQFLVMARLFVNVSPVTAPRR